MTTTEEISGKLVDYAATKHAKIAYIDGSNVAIIEALSNYIPIEDFKKIFEKAGELVKEKKIEKLVFDKRKLTVFHQPSMEWYFIEWKEEMYRFGLTKHRKLLPQDKVFRESVRIGREKIKEENPQLSVSKMDIQYKESLKEAIES